MGEAARRVPSVDQLRRLDRHWYGLDQQDRRLSPVAHIQEEDIFQHWAPLCDVIREIRPHVGSFEGYEDEDIAIPVRTLIEGFDALTVAWGWEGLNIPEPARSELVERCKERFFEQVERPLMEAALSRRAAWKGSSDIRGDVKEWADEGKARGLKATLSAAEAEARWDELKSAWYNTPRLGRCSPEFKAIGKRHDTGLRGELLLASNQLDAALKALGPDETPAPSPASSGEPERITENITAMSPGHVVRSLGEAVEPLRAFLADMAVAREGYASPLAEMAAFKVLFARLEAVWDIVIARLPAVPGEHADLAESVCFDIRTRLRRIAESWNLVDPDNPKRLRWRPEMFGRVGCVPFRFDRHIDEELGAIARCVDMLEVNCATVPDEASAPSPASSDGQASITEKIIRPIPHPPFTEDVTSNPCAFLEMYETEAAALSGIAREFVVSGTTDRQAWCRANLGEDGWRDYERRLHFFTGLSTELVGWLAFNVPSLPGQPMLELPGVLSAGLLLVPAGDLTASKRIQDACDAAVLATSAAQAAIRSRTPDAKQPAEPVEPTGTAPSTMPDDSDQSAVPAIEKPPANKVSSDQSREPDEGRATETSAPRDLKELAAILRRDRPRLDAMARLFDYMHMHSQANFEDLSDYVHRSNVELETVGRKIKKGREIIRKYFVPVQLVVSGTTVSRRDIPMPATSPETSPETSPK